MTIEKIEIVIIGKDKGGKKVIDKQTKALKKMEKEVKALEKTMKKGAVAAAAIAVAFKAAFELGRRGAVVRQTTAAFHSLMGGIRNAEFAMLRYQEAVDGTVSRMDIMTSVTTALAGTQGELKEALTAASGDLLKIAKAASALNPKLGNTAFVFESLVRGIKRSSPLIIDNANIVLKLGEAYSAYADELGVTVEELSSTQKQMALLNETIKGGNVLVEQAGDLAESQIDPFDRFTASIRDVTDAILETDGVASGFFDNLGEDLSTDAKLVREFGLGVTLLADAFGHTDVLIAIYNERVKEMVELEETLVRAREMETQGIFDMSDAYFDSLHPAQRAATEAWQLEVELLKDATAEAENWINTFTRSIEITDSIESINETLDELHEKEKDLTSEIVNFRREAGQTGVEASRELLLLKGELNGVQTEIREVTAAWDEQTKNMLFNMVQQRLAIDGFTAEEFAALGKLAGPEGFGLIDQAAADFIGEIDKSALSLDAAGDQSDIFVQDLLGLQTELSNAGLGVGKLADGINMLPEEITIKVNFEAGSVPNLSGTKVIKPPADVLRHLGGHGVVPAGFPNDSFMVGLTTGEEFNVTRRGAVGEDRRRRVTAPAITFIYNPTVSTASEEEARRVFQPFIEAGYRQLQEERAL